MRPARAGFRDDGLPEIALVGRSNVGKSTLINALIGRTLARTSAAPGKTRLVNVYRVTRRARAARSTSWTCRVTDTRAAARPSAEAFEALTTAYFDARGDGTGRAAAAGRRRRRLLLVDARHPGLDNDRRGPRLAGGARRAGRAWSPPRLTS